ncbi:hypothetical protein PFISCL1PPCAC_2678 [Pristionchus fissidentatus]|uniref:Uncharacterized protein n=1 Tax=Pristionchus fissidentatus TaxID=1538716 RepID=A0AAV5UWE3_9BILA|nr:hypothetical protein PFISCL1PPCAC_2678 [Pristionchus fissidentatus]
MDFTEMISSVSDSSKEGECPCCRDVTMCREILRRFNGKMNTLMQHVNMLCVLEGIKEVLPRATDDAEDDLEVYGGADPERIAVMQGMRAASSFIREAKGEVAVMNKTLNNLDSSGYNKCRPCSLNSCARNTRKHKMVTREMFDRDIKDRTLLVPIAADRRRILGLFDKSFTELPICERHWSDHVDNMGPKELRLCDLCSTYTMNYHQIKLSTFDNEESIGNLVIPSMAEKLRLCEICKRRDKIVLCASHWNADEKKNKIPLEALYDDDEDSEDVRRMKETLALPTSFQPRYGKRRRVEEDEVAGTSVKVEVNDDDDKMLSNNELLQQLLGGAIAGQVTGEIGENGDVYEGGVEDEEMEQLTAHDEPSVASEEREEEEAHEDEEEEDDDDDEPPQLD